MIEGWRGTVRLKERRKRRRVREITRKSKFILGPILSSYQPKSYYPLMTEKRIRGDKPIDEINKKQIT